MMKLLILNGESLNSLAIARSLSEWKIDIYLGGRFFSPTFFSRYKKKYFFYKFTGYFDHFFWKTKGLYENLKEERKFCKWLINLANDMKIDVILPLFEDTIIPISKFCNSQKKIRIVSPNYKQLIKLHDKLETYKICKSKHIKFPKLFSDEKEIKKETFVKPNKGRSSFLVKLCKNKKEVLDTSNKIKNLGLVPLIQKKINYSKKGTGTFLIKNGKVITYFSAYIKNGIIISKRDEKMEQIVRKFFRGSSYTGVVSPQFLIDKKNYWLIEINPRLPGGIIHYMLLCGFDAPKLLLSLYKEKKIKGTFKENIIFPLDYSYGWNNFLHQYFHSKFGLKKFLTDPIPTLSLPPFFLYYYLS